MLENECLWLLPAAATAAAVACLYPVAHSPSSVVSDGALLVSQVSAPVTWGTRNTAQDHASLYNRVGCLTVPFAAAAAAGHLAVRCILHTY
jgi:hypothetical protein